MGLNGCEFCGMSWIDVLSLLLDERAIIETSAIAIGSSLTALFHFLFRRANARAKKVEGAPSLNIDSSLRSLVQDSPKSHLPYVAITGNVQTHNQPLQCRADNSIKGVIWKKSTVEHKDVYRKYTQTWDNTTREISSVSDNIAFNLQGQSSYFSVEVVNPLESSWIEDSIEIVHERFNPTTRNAMENIVGYMSGDKLKGYTETERMLRLGTKLCAIGELVYEEGMMKIRAPLGAANDYIISKLSQQEIVSSIQRKAKIWKILAIVVAAATATGVYFMVRRFRRRYKEIKENQRFYEELNVIREQRTAVSARLNRGGEAEGQEPCVVCLTNPRECVLLECGHICICVDCLEAIPSPKECPVCRSSVVRTVPLFRA